MENLKELREGGSCRVSQVNQAFARTFLKGIPPTEQYNKNSVAETGYRMIKKRRRQLCYEKNRILNTIQIDGFSCFYCRRDVSSLILISNMHYRGNFFTGILTLVNLLKLTIA